MIYFLISIFALAFLLIVCFTLACIHFFGLTTFISNLFTYFTNNTSSHQFDRQYNNQKPIYNQQCLICLQKITNQVVATCGHSYCAVCIIDYWQHSNFQKMECPACRQKICILMRNFKCVNQEQKKLKLKITEYNRKYGQNSTFIRSIRQFVNLLPYLKNWIFSRQGLSYLLQNNRLRPIVLSILYLISPIDLIPEIIFGPFGIIDDGFVTLNTINIITNLFIGFMRQQ